MYLSFNSEEKRKLGLFVHEKDVHIDKPTMITVQNPAVSKKYYNSIDFGLQFPFMQTYISIHLLLILKRTLSSYLLLLAFEVTR